MATNMKSPKTYLLMFPKATGDQVCDEGHLLKIDDSAKCIAEESELKKKCLNHVVFDLPSFEASLWLALSRDGSMEGSGCITPWMLLKKHCTWRLSYLIPFIKNVLTFSSSSFCWNFNPPFHVHPTQLSQSFITSLNHTSFVSSHLFYRKLTSSLSTNSAISLIWTWATNRFVQSTLSWTIWIRLSKNNTHHRIRQLGH